ncbi:MULTISPECIES: LysE family translocator [Nitrospirillum]|uniref:Threonine/homoserine/homoserine lactone efflux protein n=1 Tax=Nitrospirillum amazonense TaxID=28077 RepID=A0A560G1P1_9PROT|nr:LysE family transporter [Nitrospirillum amazonense]MEC4589380.1 LysE family transporter [Nitrospirillum amazonense]TWB27813.1 threonine/homoserine/homoserine lactone efflux protein [Nitrospirillum amazonense]
MDLDTLITIAPNLFLPAAFAGVFLKAMLLGLGVAAPVGPMAFLCMRRTLAGGWRLGLATGAGIATGDGVYAGIAALGLTEVSAFVTDHGRPLHLLAGLFLGWLAYAALRPKPAGPETLQGDNRPAALSTLSLPRAWASSFLLTLTNPPTIIVFAAMLTAFVPLSALSGAEVARLRIATTVAGVAAGSLLWWVVLVAGVAALRGMMAPRVARALDITAGLAFLAFAAVELHRAVLP